MTRLDEPGSIEEEFVAGDADGGRPGDTDSLWWPHPPVGAGRHVEVKGLGLASIKVVDNADEETSERKEYLPSVSFAWGFRWGPEDATHGEP